MNNGNVSLISVNYLAHFYLAHPDEDLMFGNFIGDGVRGSDFKRFPDAISRGIRFHRFIDTYTDTHQEVLEAKKLFYASQSKFSGVVVDVMFDHLLAIKWSDYSPENLDAFAAQCYAIIERQRALLPMRSERFFQYMSGNNILPKYAVKDGITNVFRGMDSRTKYTSNMQTAMEDMVEFRSEFELHFNKFFPNLVAACDLWKKEN